MKKIVLLLLVVMAALNARSQTFTVVNNSKYPVYFQVSGSDLNSCNNKYTSMVVMAAPAATMVYGRTSELQWSGDKPGNMFEYTSFSANYTDPSGACVSNASNNIGEGKCRMATEAAINTAKCGAAGNINLSWSSKNGNVLVTIN